jgi:serine/threonine protein kinase
VADEKRLDACLAKMRADMPDDMNKAAGILIDSGVLTNFQADNILAGKWRRFSIGKYKVLERLGHGGFAQVYLCEHKLMRRRVAVKVLPVGKTKNTSALARFHREARAAAELDHPNIVHAYDIDQDEDLHFFVMEFIDGANFQEIVARSGRMGVLRACHYIRQAALALQHAHEHNLVHRDIKPGNLLVDRTGVVKLLDLGLALRLDDKDDNLTRIHEDGTLGTADYLSPEQAMDSHEVDIRTDIYSLGVTFYFLLAGRPPYEGMPIASKLMAHQMKQPRPLTDFRQDIPAGVLAIIDKMMAKKANDRYAVPGEVADALEPFTQEPIEPPSEEEMPKLSPAAMGDAETAMNRGDTPVAPGRGGSSGAVRVIKSVPAAPTAPALPALPSAGLPPVVPYKAFTPEVGLPPSKEKARPFASRSNPLFIGLLILGFLAVTMLVIGVIAGVAMIFFSTPPAVKTGPRKLEVSRDASRKGAYASIQAALREAEAGSVIELWDDTYEENVLIAPRGTQRTAVTIQAARDKEIVWKSAKSDPGEPIVVLSTADSFKLKGKGITFDGTLAKKGNVNDLIRISFGCPGLVIEDVTFKNFEHSAVFIINAAGSSAKPIKLQRLTTESTDKNRAAIYFDAKENVVSTRVNENIEIDDTCIFRGHDPAKAIQSREVVPKGPLVFGNNVRWPGK